MLKEFCRLSAKNNLHEIEDQLVSRFIIGLSLLIQQKTLIEPYMDNESINLATKVERQLQRAKLKSTKWKLLIDLCIEKPKFLAPNPNTKPLDLQAKPPTIHPIF